MENKNGEMFFDDCPIYRVMKAGQEREVDDPMPNRHQALPSLADDFLLSWRGWLDNIKILRNNDIVISKFI